MKICSKERATESWRKRLSPFEKKKRQEKKMISRKKKKKKGLCPSVEREAASKPPLAGLREGGRKGTNTTLKGKNVSHAAERKERKGVYPFRRTKRGAAEAPKRGKKKETRRCHGACKTSPSSTISERRKKQVIDCGSAWGRGGGGGKKKKKKKKQHLDERKKSRIGHRAIALTARQRRERSSIVWWGFVRP